MAPTNQHKNNHTEYYNQPSIMKGRTIVTNVMVSVFSPIIVIALIVNETVVMTKKSFAPAQIHPAPASFM
jgi:hypothetical protein